MKTLPKTILMATNLKEFNKIAFDVAISLSVQHNAKLVLLHVLEKMPEPLDDDQIWKRLAWLRGTEQREAKRRTEIETVRRSLLGKNIGSAMIKDALRTYYESAGIDEASRLPPLKEVIVAEGEIVQEILDCAKEHNCSLIVMAAHEGLFGKTSISGVLRDVLKRAAVPVLTVPSTFSLE